jgi:serine protease AprX
MSVRYKLIFPDGEHLRAALAVEEKRADLRVINHLRNTISIDGGDYPDEQHLLVAERYQAKITKSHQYQIDGPDVFDPTSMGPDAPTNPSLDDVLAKIRAPVAWSRLQQRGGKVTIAVIDTGIDGTRPEFRSRQAGGWVPLNSGWDPWADPRGHGTMCACIATGSRTNGGIFDGVAPDANIMSCRTDFWDDELTAIYDELTRRARGGEHIIATNSFGECGGHPPSITQDQVMLDAISDAIAAGVCVVFSAGNNHDLTGAPFPDCSPTSIWLHKCRDDLLTVGTCKLDDTMWHYSSRGPGQSFGSGGTNKKPDVVAPTPENGRILYGSDVKVLSLGWGTSGACPQVAGLAALLKAHNSSLANNQIFDIIQKSALDVGLAWECQGAGLINCDTAANLLLAQTHAV